MFITTALTLWAFSIAEVASKPIEVMAFTDTMNTHLLPFQVAFTPRQAAAGGGAGSAEGGAGGAGWLCLRGHLIGFDGNEDCKLPQLRAFKSEMLQRRPDKITGTFPFFFCFSSHYIPYASPRFCGLVKRVCVRAVAYTV